MVENKNFNEVVLRCSRLENRSANLELKLQHQKERFLNNKPLNNKDAHENLEFFIMNEWQAKLDVKYVSIVKLKKHIKNLKGKNVVEKDATPSNAKVIAQGMCKLDLEPLSPNVLKNRDAHIDYIKHSQEHADMLRELVEHGFYGSSNLMADPVAVSMIQTASHLSPDVVWIIQSTSPEPGLESSSIFIPVSYLIRFLPK
ncbi:hypothetical protein Tco_0445286 [Tanacetum coccineum]